MSYDKTLLYSGSTNVKTVTLSEPLSAFERFEICVSPNVVWESEVSANCNFHRFDRYGSWNTDGYFIWPTNYVVSNDTKTIDVNHFQMLMQNGTSAQLRTFGFNNTANNCACIRGIWGINRKNHVDDEGIGSPGEGWMEYNETPLWSGTDRPEHIHLSEKAIAFERLKVSVGSHGESINMYDVDAPTKYDTWLPLYSYWGTSLGSYYLSMHRYKFLGDTDELSAVSGKTWQLGSGAANPYTGTGSYTSTESYVRKPLIGIWGINKKPVRTVHVLDGDHGSASASMSSGYEGEPVTLTSTPDEGWYLSGYNISGATLSGNQFMIEDEDVTVQPLFTDQEKRTITIVQPTGGTISASVLEGFDGTVVTLSNSPATGYDFESYSVTGATLSGNSFMINGSDVTVTGTFTANQGVVYSKDTEYGANSTIFSNVSVSKGNYIVIKYDSKGRFAESYGELRLSVNGDTSTTGAWRRYYHSTVGDNVLLRFGENSMTNTSNVSVKYDDYYYTTKYKHTTYTTFKLIINRSTHIAECYVNGTYFGRGSINSAANNFTLTNLATTRQMYYYVKNVRVAWFNNLNDAKSY